MIQPSQRNNSRGILSRLLRDEMGNTIAIMAAAVIPTIGLVGGAVDVSRLYLVKARMQAACDAGSLMGRKVMGTGTWAAHVGDADVQARKIFDLNYKDGDYGTSGLAKSFSEDAGNVTGVASVSVKLSIMRPLIVKKAEKDKATELEADLVNTLGRPLSKTEKATIAETAATWAQTQDGTTIAVGCQSEMAIPNSDVMFVLDVTGSMDDTDSNGVKKIDGLKKATKCFFEALQKEDIAGVSPADCGTTANPSGGNTSDVAIRFGFVPYSVNVNVGKLLPLDWIADNWTYQSREADWVTNATWDPIYGTEPAPTQYGTPTTTTAGSWGSWNTSGGNVTIGTTTYFRRFNSTSPECAATTAPSLQSNNSTGSMNFVSQDPNPPVYPATTSVVRYYSQITSNTESEYRYTWSSSNGGRCSLQLRTRDLGSTTRTFNSTVPVTWQRSRTFNGWNYKPTTFNVSGLKDSGNNAWRNSVSIPIGANGANISAVWDGCVEERQTSRLPNTNPTTASWNPIPIAAKDMDIDLVPSTTDPTTQWGPILKDVVYGRNWNGSRTKNNLGPNDFDYNEGSVNQYDPSCPMPAKLYQEWDPAVFETYVNTLTPTSYTYHDIGLLWGARLMSPTGIFSNLTAPANRDIQRHMIFMTDGDTNADISSYSAYGMDWWDRRQNDGSAAPSDAWLEANINSRTQAICTWVKNKNISLWVISFGTDVTSSAQTALQNCASPGKYYNAANASQLVDNFRSIASEISMLRLTS
jgi:Flp pilus assembly protein TadG